MGNEDRRIVKYVIFGSRDDLTQFPRADFVETEGAQFRPVFLFWDKTDEILVRFYEKWRDSETKGLKKIFRESLSVAARRHIQNKYKEVFLSNPETLFLSEKAEKEIPQSFWEERPWMQKELLKQFGREASLRILGQADREVTVFSVLDEECKYEMLSDWLFEAEKTAGPKMTDLFLFGDSEQKEYAEEILENFYEETGLAGTFCLVSECRRIGATAKGEVLLMDERGLAADRIGRPAYYIDGAGVRTRKEIKRLTGVCERCYSLRNHLDRAFLSAL